jgi:hypothetical protein
MAGPPPVNSPSRRAHRGRHGSATRASAGPPDLAAAAKEAVVSFLHDASAATAEREAARAPSAGTGAERAFVPAARNPSGEGSRETAEVVPEMPYGPPPAAGQLAAQAVVLRAAAISVATLDRIESTAAKVEADIAAALQAHSELQAGAGAAAEAAVQAAQAAWVAAGTAVEADRQAKISLRMVGRYVAATAVLVVVELIIFVLFATSAH